MRLGIPFFPFVPQPPPIRNYNNNYQNFSTNTNVQNLPANTVCEEKEDNSSPFLEILGIKLDFDDFLILGLLFFLYAEGTGDQMLYMVLVMLLLS